MLVILESPISLEHWTKSIQGPPLARRGRCGSGSVVPSEVTSSIWETPFPVCSSCLLLIRYDCSLEGRHKYIFMALCVVGQ